MATSGQLIDAVTSLFGIPRSLVETWYRSLREEGLVSKGGRGPSAARMTPADAACLLIACGGARFDRESAAKTCRNYMALPVHNQNNSTWFAGDCPLPQLASLPTNHSAGEALTALVESAVAGDLQTTLTEDFGANVKMLLAEAVKVQFWGPLPQCRIQVGLRDHQRTSELKVYADNAPSDIEAIPDWADRLSRKYGKQGDLLQIREFTGRSIIALGKLLRQPSEAPNA